MKKPQALIGLLAALGTAIGVLVAVVGLPYGRANYTAFADLYHNGGTPAIGVIDLAVDCDTSAGGVQDNCDIVLPAASAQVGVTIGNNTGSASSIGSFNFEVQNPDVTELDTVDENPPSQPAADSNPEQNDEGYAGLGNLGCTPPDPDEDNGSVIGGQSAFLSCFTGAANGPALANDSVHQTLAFVDYTIGVGALIGDSELISLSNVAVSDNSLTEIGSCNPVIDVASACFPATINFIAPPPPTITNTPAPPTITNTPAPTNTPVPGVNVVKVPECDDGVPSPDDVADLDDNSDDTDVTANDNCDLSNPAEPLANLWLCEAPAPCDDAGEGSLHVHENAGPIADGVGAYEFQVEYDHFVISSVNPCDFLFGPANGTEGAGAGAARGPVDEVNSSSPANPDCTPDPGAVNNGTCTMSLIQENSVRFGCVTRARFLVRRRSPA